ncbi:MAG: ribonuclease P protein component [Gemmatimonadota bacterium]
MTRATDLDRVRRHGKRFRPSHLEDRQLASLLHHSRVGLIVPKHRHGSVERNLVKRRLRDAVRRALWPVLHTADAQGAPSDLVVWATPSSYAVTFDALLGEVQRIARRVTTSREAPVSESRPRVVEDPS